MPTGRDLVPALKWAGGITVMVLILKLFKLPCYFSLSGCILCILVLLLLLHIEKSQYAKLLELERKGKDAVSQLSGNVQLHYKESVKRRQQKSCASNEDSGVDGSDDES